MRLRSDGITWQEIDGELVILDMNRSAYLTTNKTGAFIAKFLQDDHTVDEVRDALISEFAIDGELAERDAASFVATLRERELLA